MHRDLKPDNDKASLHLRRRGHQGARIGIKRGREQGLTGAHLHRAAQIHHHHVVGDLAHHRKIVAAAFIGIVFALVALGTVTNLAAVIAAAVAIGFFAIGGQLVLYALASSSYPDAIRATGVGVAIAIGRIGAIVGPVLVGSVLSAGYGSRGFVAVVLPGIVAAGAAVFALTCRLGRSDLDASAQAEH